MDAFIDAAIAGIDKAYTTLIDSSPLLHADLRMSVYNIAVYYEAVTRSREDLSSLNRAGMVTADRQALFSALRHLYSRLPTPVVSPLHIPNIPDSKLLKLASDFLRLTYFHEIFRAITYGYRAGLIPAEIRDGAVSFKASPDDLGIGTALQVSDEIRVQLESVHAALAAVAERTRRRLSLLPGPIGPQLDEKNFRGVLTVAIRESAVSVFSAQNFPDLPSHVRFDKLRWGEIRGLFLLLFEYSLRFLARAKVQKAECRTHQNDFALPDYYHIGETIRFPKRSSSLLVLPMTRLELTQVAYRELGLSAEKLRWFIRRYAAGEALNRAGTDNGWSPCLLTLTSDDLVLLPSMGMFILDADMILRFLNALSPTAFGTHVARRLGEVPARVADRLRGQQHFRVISNETLRSGGRDLTDIDLGVYDLNHNIFLCCEFKSLWVHDLIRIQSTEERIATAIRQLKATEAELRRRGVEGIGKLFGGLSKLSEMPRFLKIVVTRRNYGRGSYQGIPVISRLGLERALEECRFDRSR